MKKPLVYSHKMSNFALIITQQNMKLFKSIATFVLAAFMIFGGIMHFKNPTMYNAFIPDFLPEKFINIATGILEIALGIAAYTPQFRPWATRGIFLLMVAFLPLHILDVFSDQPAIGSHQAAMIRLPVQLVLIVWAWFIQKK